MAKNSCSALVALGIMTLTTLSAFGAQSHNIHINGQQTPGDQTISLGAGDSLGQACFAKYVKAARARQHLETREATNTRPVRPVHPMPRLIARVNDITSLPRSVTQVQDRVYVQLRHHA